MKSATFTAKIPQAGRYDVRIAYTANPNRATNVPIAIESKSGTRKVRLNQREAPKQSGFQSVATLRIETDESVSVTISNADADGHVIVDAVQFVPVQ